MFKSITMLITNIRDFEIFSRSLIYRCKNIGRCIANADGSLGALRKLVTLSRFA